MTQTREAAYWLDLLCDDHLKRRLVKSVIHRWCIEEKCSLSSLFALSQSDLMQQFGLSAQQAERLLAIEQRASSQSSLLDDLSRRGVGLFTRADVAYPDALVERLPEEWLPYFCFYRGSLTNLTEPGLAILGSMHPSPDAQKVARRLAGMLAQDGHHLIGGYDKGIDRLALDAACDVGGQVTLLLPLGINRFDNVASPIEEALRTGRGLLLSPYAPNAEYSESLARARRALVAALGEVLLLVAPDHGPDEWPAIAKLAGATGNVFVWAGSDAERARAWIEVGAIPFEDAASARKLVLDLLGAVPAPSANDRGDMGDLEDTEPILFEDADSAIEVLGKSGNVPEVLARRLREMTSSYSSESNNAAERDSPV